MTSIHLDKFMSGHVFAFVFIFARIGSVIMLFPGLGESYVSPRMRLMFAFSLSFLLMEPLLGRVPMPPENIGELFRLLSYEIIIGLFFGTILRLLLSTLETAGSVISLQIGLSNATILNPALAIQSTLASAMLSVAGVTLLFITGLDHLLFRSLTALYEAFPPGGLVMAGDMTQTVIQMTNRGFVVGIELAMPFLVIGVLMYVALGIMQKLLPQVQLFIITLPLQIWGGLGLMAITFAGMLTIWLHYFDASIGALFTR